jgi:hypothetical protein
VEDPYCVAVADLLVLDFLCSLVEANSYGNLLLLLDFPALED